MKNKKTKLAIFAGNPVQYHAPIYRLLHADDEIDLTVLYGSDIGAKEFYSKEFECVIKWDISLTDGYEYKYFKNLAGEQRKGFFSRINPGMFFHVLLGGYDAVLIHGYDTFSAWLVFIASKLSFTKVIWRGEAAIRPSNRKSPLKQFVKSYILPLYFKMCNAVMYSCTGNLEYLKQFKINPAKIFRIPCAANNDFFQAERAKHMPKRDEMRQEIGINKDDMAIMFTARFVQRKRPLDLLEAIAKIPHDNIVVIFAGGGGLEKEMKEFAANNNIRTVFTGFIGQTELARYLTLADMFAIVSDYDASPKSMNEALNFYLPILTTDKVGTAFDLVKNGENGFIVESRDIDAMAEKINYINSDKERARVMGEKSFELTKEWNFQKDVEGIKQALRYILN